MDKKTASEEEILEETVLEETAEAETAPETIAGEDQDAKLSELNDRYMRMAAEYENFRKRSQREREGIHAEAVAYAVKAMLPTIDNLERALKVETADTDYKKGVEMTFTQLLDSLKGIGVAMIEAAPGTEFDPNLHNAVMHIESDDFGENQIAEVFQQGFTIGDKVIRHSMVQVAN